MKIFSLLFRPMAFAIVGLVVIRGGAQDLPSNQAKIDERIVEIVKEWEALPSIFDDIEIYARQMKEIVEIGPPAVPALTAALDETTQDTALRLVPFALRAIGDARAVPALIRNFPKTLRPPGSDCGMTVDDPELLQFMQTHDVATAGGHGGTGRQGFDMGRPVRELSAALRKITGTELNEGGVFHTFLSGGELQRALQREAFEDVARNWADWWKENWKRFVNEPAFAEVGLKAAPAPVGSKRFLSGEGIRVDDGIGGMVLSPVESGRQCALDLALNRIVDIPEGLLENGAATNDFGRISAWAARAGVDLMGAQYHDSLSGKTYYCLRAVGLQAWQIGVEHYEEMEQLVKNNTLPPLGSPAGDLLMYYDEAQGRYLPERKAAFLFITRDGVQGVLRLTAQITKPFDRRMLGMPLMVRPDSGPDQPEESGFHQGAKFDYRFIFEETEDVRREEIARREAAEEKKEARLQHKLELLFEEHPPLRGTVLLPDGKPASNTTVLLGLPGESAILGDRAFIHTDYATVTQTSDQGEFVLPHVPTAHHIYVAHVEGFASVDIEDVTPPVLVRLGPWGRIEGTVTINGKPAPHQKLAVLDAYKPAGSGLSHSPGTFTTESDAEGKFIISNLPPGEVFVSRMVENTYYHAQPVRVLAGKTTRMVHGFNGRRLVGRVVTSVGTTAEWSRRSFRFSTKLTAPEPPPGEDPEVWVNNWWESDEGKERQRQRVNFAVMIEPSGEFNIDDVPPGIYELSGELREGGANDFWMAGKVLGRLSREITVPEEASEVPLDLGEMVLQMVTVLKPGDVAPDFEVATLGGESLSLTDFRGKYVLLDFWATWCAPCRKEIPHLKELDKAYEGHPRFAMISLSLDKSRAPLLAYVKKEGLGWHHAILKDGWKSALAAQYGVQAIPATFLIDPEGRIVQTDLRGEESKDALGAVLEAP